MSSIILMSDPRVAAIPVRECDERLVDVRGDVTTGALAVDDRLRDAAGAYAHLRAGVVARLLEAQAGLPSGLRLLVIEGYRPPALQRHYFDGYAEQVRAEYPNWTDARVRAAASRFVSPPEIAPHSAGAAVDLTLVDSGGRELDLGTEVNAYTGERAGDCYTAADTIGAVARANRRILADALAGAGLVNYPTEWWHWSYGDRYWALATGAPAALYGPCERDP
jgi:zinc D-Ala-D-Ala dipeptidase